MRVLYVLKHYKIVIVITKVLLLHVTYYQILGMETILDEQNSSLPTPIPGLLPPHPDYLFQVEELDFFHQGEQQTKFLSISVTHGRGIWLEPEKRKQQTSLNTCDLSK